MRQPVASSPMAATRRKVRRPDPPPLPYDGVGTVTVGTLAWLVALLVMLPFHDRLEREGRLWWIAAAAIGFGLGLLGVWYCRRRTDRLRRRQADSDGVLPGRTPSDR